jgi:DNA-binding transcriptional LysR family regulator
MLDVHQLNVFLVAAETLSFTQAAQRLHMTQPSVSQHIQGLEAHFDTPLFIRAGRNLELSEAGLTLLPLAREAVSLSIRIDETMESLKGKVYGHMVVGCSTTPGKYILPQLLAQFHHNYPQVRVTCQVTPQTEAIRMVEAGEAHFALFSMHKEAFADVEALPFICDPIILITPLDHPWAKREEITVDELVDTDFIMREPTSGTYNAVREALAQHGLAITDLNVLITLGNSEAIALAVLEGLGVAFISKMVVDRLCPERVAIVRVHGLEICRDIYIGHNNRRPATAAQSAFWDFVIKKVDNSLEISQSVHNKKSSEV